MNLVLVDREEVTDSKVELRGRRAKHILNVIAPAIGDTLRVAVESVGRGQATVLELAPNRVCLELGPLLPPEPIPPTSLVLALPRPKVLARVVSAAVSMGVTELHLVNAWRVEKSYFQSPSLEPEALRMMARLGCEQGGLVRVPPIVVYKRFMLWASAAETAFESGAAQKLVADPRATQSLAGFAQRITSKLPVVTCVGPEGGWIDRELATFERLGFESVSIGPTILRVESAVSSLLGQLELVRNLESGIAADKRR